MQSSFKMNDFIQTVLVLGIIDFGTGVVASVLAILWGYLTRTDMDKDMVVGLFKIFMGGAAVFFVGSILYVYSVKY